MAKKQSDENEKNIEESSKEKEVGEKEASESKSEEKTVLPRKRKIVKNVQLPVVVSIFVVFLLAVVVWKCFFDQSIIGVWSFTAEGEYTETLDAPESEDQPEKSVTHSYSQRICYDFRDDGVCAVTLGTTTVEGSYSVFSTPDGNIVAPAVAYQYTPVFYGSYSYDIKGNVFTGRKLVITDGYGEELELEPGAGENPLTAYEDFTAVDELVGTWRDEEYGITYEFSADGFLTSRSDDGLVVDYAYTKFEDGYLLVKCYGNGEQADAYTYSFEGDKTYINGSIVEKVK